MKLKIKKFFKIIHHPVNKGFTLIELLVVIGIIGLLSAVIVPNFMGARERSRDTQRKSDVRQLQKALEMYKDDQTPVPKYLTVAEYNALTCNSEWKNAAGTVYMSKFPCDPSNPTSYHYPYTNDSSLVYTLIACLENKSDPQGNSSASCNWGGSAEGIQYKITQP